MQTEEMTAQTQEKTVRLDGVSAFTQAWKLMTTKTNELMPFVVLIIGSLILYVILEMADLAVFSLIASILQLSVSFVAYKGFLQVIRGNKVDDLMTMFQQYGQIFRFFLTGFVVAMIVLFGFAVLIIPGIYFALKYGFSTLSSIDEGLGVGASMDRSAAVTKGREFELLGFFIIAFIVNVIGFILVGFGLLFTIPLTMLATTVLYESWKQV